MTKLTCTIAVPRSFVSASSPPRSSNRLAPCTHRAGEIQIYPLDSQIFLETHHAEMRADIDTNECVANGGAKSVRWKCTLDESIFERFVSFFKAFIALIALDVRPLVSESLTRRELASFEAKLSLIDQTHLRAKNLGQYLRDSRDILDSTFNQYNLVPKRIKTSLGDTPPKPVQPNDIDANPHHVGDKVKEEFEKAKEHFLITRAVTQLTARLTNKFEVTNEQIPTILYLMHGSSTDAFMKDALKSFNLPADTQHVTTIHFRRDKTKPGEIVCSKTFLFNAGHDGADEMFKTIKFRISPNGNSKIEGTFPNPVAA